MDFLNSEQALRGVIREEIASLDQRLQAVRTNWEAFSCHPEIPMLPVPHGGAWRESRESLQAPHLDWDELDILSLDIFDTCVRRYTGNPLAVFTMLEEEMRLADAAGPGFAGLRKEVEEALRHQVQEKGTAEDVSLPHIYSELADRLDWDPSVETRWLERECQLELAQVISNPAIRELAREALARGKTLIYITEMYLPLDILAELLVKAGFPVKAGTVFASGELGLSKGSGRLFRHVLRQFPGKRICHVGDNPETDHAAPKREGFMVAPVPHLKPRHEDPLSQVLLELTSGDKRGCEDFWMRLGYGVVAPLAVAWVNDIIRHCRMLEIEKLLFLTRDGYFPQKAFAALKGHLAPHLNSTTCFSSRRLLGIAAMDTISAEDWDFLLKPAPEFRIRDFFQRVEIPPSQYEPACRAAGLDPDRVVCHHRGFYDPQTKDHLYAVFCQVIDDFYTFRDGLRSRLQAYMKDLVSRRERTAIVDIGWNASSMDGFDRLFGRDFLTAGFYLGVWKERMDRESGDNRLLPFLGGDEHLDEDMALLKGGVALMEFLLGSPEGSVANLNYKNGKWEPVYARPDVVGVYERAAYAAIEEGFEAFLSDFIAVDGPYVPGSGREYCRHALGKLIYDPSREELEKLGRVTHVEGWGGGRRLRLLPDVGHLSTLEARRLAYCYSGWKAAWSHMDFA